MNALTASIPHVHRSDALWLIPLLPLVAAIANGPFGDVVERRLGRRGALVVSASASALSLLVAGVSTVEIGGLDADARQLLAVGPAFARVGSLDAGLALLFDPTAAALAIAVAVLSLVAHARATARGEGAGVYASIALATSGALLAVLADGVLSFLVGAGITAAGCAASFGRAIDEPEDREDASRAGTWAFVSMGGAGVAALLGAATVLFWTLGGSWGIALGNEPTYTRRNPVPVAVVDAEVEDAPVTGPALVAVRSGAGASQAAPSDPTARGQLTLVDWPGARLYLRGSLEPAAVSPVVRHEVYAGRIDVEIEPYPGAKRIHLHAVEVPPGGEVVLAPIGPTLSFRALRDQLSFVDATKQRLVRNLLDPSAPARRRAGPFVAGTLAALLLVLAGAALAAQGPFAGWIGPSAVSGGFAVVVAPLVGVGLLARASFLVSLSPGAAATCAGLGAVTALGCALTGCVQRDERRALALASASGAGFALVAIGIGAPALAVVHAIASALAVEVLRLARALPHGDPRVARGARIAAIAIAGAPIPLLGPSWSRVEIVARVATVDVPWAGFAKVVVLAGLAAIAATSVLVVRATADEPEASAAPELPRLPALVLALAAIVAAFGPVAFGLGLSGPRAEAAVVGLAVAGLGVVAAFVSTSVARRKLDEGPPAERRPFEALGAAIAGAVRLAGSGVAWIDEKVLDAPGRAVGERLAPRASESSDTAPPTVPR